MTTATKTSISYAVTPPDMPSVAIVGYDDDVRFPVHRIYCVGRNYSEHVKEMGGNPASSSPTFFCKPADAVVPSGSVIPYPTATSDLHYEVELVIAIGQRQPSKTKQISLDEAESYIFGYAVGIDLTRRDLQNAAKEKGLPWDSAKAFDRSAPIGPITPGSLIGENNVKMEMLVNGNVRQSTTLNHMIWSVPQIIQQLSMQFELQPGDLIFTGTPSGVGPTVPGDTLIGTVDGLEKVEITIAEPN